MSEDLNEKTEDIEDLSADELSEENSVPDADFSPEAFSDEELFSGELNSEEKPLSEVNPEEGISIPDFLQKFPDVPMEHYEVPAAEENDEAFFKGEIGLPEGIFENNDGEQEGPRKRTGSKKIMFAAIAIAALAAVILIIVLSMNRGESVPEEPEETPVVTEKISAMEIRHLSFPQLSLEKGEGKLSVDEFRTILEELYSEGYSLVDFYSIADVSDDGVITLNENVDVPEGRKPLIISQRDVSYPIDKAGNGYASRLVIADDGSITCEVTDASGNVSLQNADVIPVLEEFIQENPLFSCNGARGIIALTGYNGILGYRTSSYLSSQENNPYGIFDTGSEINQAAPVVEKLKSLGWRFASYGFDRLSYGAEYSMVEADVAKWHDQVGDLVGGTDILIFPKQTDIGSWAPYSSGNRKFTLLRDNGFRYFFINETETPWLIQYEDDFIRQGIVEVNTYEDFTAAFK